MKKNVKRKTIIKATLKDADGNVELEYEIGSGNVFADLGLPDAEGLLRKARRAAEIRHSIAAQGS